MTMPWTNPKILFPFLTLTRLSNTTYTQHLTLLPHPLMPTITTTTMTIPTTTTTTMMMMKHSWIPSAPRSQSVPRPAYRTLPQDLVDNCPDQTTAAELEVLLQTVPEPFLQTFYKCARLHVPPVTLRDHMIPSWVASHSASSANTKP